MKRIAIITHLPLWHPGAGDRARVRAMVKFLSQYAEVVVVILEPPSAWTFDVWRKTELFEAYFKEYPMVHAVITNDKDIMRALTSALSDLKIEAAVFIHLLLEKLLPAVPANVLTAIDTNDLLSERSPSLAAIEKTDEPPLSFEDEIKILDKFDLIILIKEEDRINVSKRLEPEKLILAPHPVDFSQRRIRDQPKIVGFVGSRYEPNIWAMNTFIGDVWPSLQDLGMQLNIYGAVGQGIDAPRDESVVIRGFVENENTIYDEIDIVVNPVLHGAGFKIKTIEALGNGLPLITTRHSAMGLPAGSDHCYLIAENAAEFQEHLRRLHGSFDERKRLGDQAYRLARDHFSPETCFTQLLNGLHLM